MPTRVTDFNAPGAETCAPTDMIMSRNHVNTYDILCTKFGLAAFNLESDMLVEINTICILIFPLKYAFLLLKSLYPTIS